MAIRREEYFEGIPERVARQVAGEHERERTSLSSRPPTRTVSESSLLLSQTAALQDEGVDTRFLMPEVLPDTIGAFKVEVAKQFQNTPQFMMELNRLFHAEKTKERRAGNVMVWTPYGLEQFKTFYANYLAREAGEEVETLLPRLEHATVQDVVFEQEGEDAPVMRPTSRASRIPVKYRKVPAPRQEEIEAGVLTGLADLSSIDEDISLADWDEERLLALTKEFDRSLAANPSQTANWTTLKVSNTKHHIDVPAGYSQFIKAPTIEAFKMAVLKEAGSKLAGLRELGQMFSVKETNGGKGKSFAWTEQGLHKFQIFLPRYVDEQRVLHPEAHSVSDASIPAHLRAADETDFDGAVTKRRAPRSSTGAKHQRAGVRSTAQVATYVHERGYIDHLSDDIYTYNPEKHFTLEEITDKLSEKFNYSFSHMQISRRINEIIKAYAEVKMPAAAVLPRDVYILKAGTPDAYQVYYTLETLKAMTASLVNQPPAEYIVDKSISDGQGIDANTIADELGLSREEFVPELVELSRMIPLSLRNGVRVTVAPYVLEALKKEGIIDEAGVNFERAGEVFSANAILQKIQEHFAHAVDDPEVFNVLREQYLELGKSVLPLQNIVFSKRDLAGYDFRDCDLSKADFTFSDISNAYLDESTVLEGAKIDGSTVANQQQRILYRSQQQTELS